MQIVCRLLGIRLTTETVMFSLSSQRSNFITMPSQLASPSMLNEDGLQIGVSLTPMFLNGLVVGHCGEVV